MGCIEIVYEGFEQCPEWNGSFLCANHPSIFDALLLFQIMPNANCVVGVHPWKHPLYSIPAKQADYIPSQPALRMVKAARKVIQAKGNIIVFPEGTRTSQGCIGSFQEGFALAAIKARATVRTIFIECSSRFLGKEFSFRAPLDLPIRFRISTGEIFHPTASDTASAFSKKLENYFRKNLVRDGEAIRKILPDT